MQKSRNISRIATERIERLFDLAQRSAKRGDKKLSARYIKIAKEISNHYRIGMPPRLKKLVCSKCGEIQISGLNSKVTIASSKHCIIYKCKCGTENKIFYSKTISN